VNLGGFPLGLKRIVSVAISRFDRWVIGLKPRPTTILTPVSAWNKAILGEETVTKPFSNLRYFVIICALLPWSDGSHAATCVLPSKRAAVSDVCGRVINPAGERLNGVELSLTSESDSATFAVESDGVGSFSFGPVPKGDYTLHATALHYHGAVRQIRVARSSDKPCTGRIVITLGFDVCDTGVRVKGTDK
jgi:hypothetical protein